MPAFQELGLVPEVLAAIDDMGWILPSDVQDEAIPLILGGGDVVSSEYSLLRDFDVHSL